MSSQVAQQDAPKLKRSLNIFHLWGIAVGLVISGEYFGWSYGWSAAGTLGFLVSAGIIAVMYTCFILSYTELASAIPDAGGPFAFAKRAFGPNGGFVAGFATLVEFVFAPPAIAMAIGAYMNVQFPSISPTYIALGAYLIFMTLNALGVKLAATFELAVTIVAICELLVFMGVVAPGFDWANFTANGWSAGDGFTNEFTGAAISGVFASIPFAIWFFLAIEGAAMSAEEAKNPRKTIPIAFCCGILTLVALALGVMIFAGGVGDWQALSNINDPLPQAMKIVVGGESGWLHMLVFLGLFGLIASFHGIILGYSRQIFALAREGFLPKYLAGINGKFNTPVRAIVAGGVVGMITILSDNVIVIADTPLTANVITMSVFGAITMYITSMLSLFKLRHSEPNMEKSYVCPLYPILPVIAIGIAVLALAAMIFYFKEVAIIYALFMVCGYIYFAVMQRRASLRAAVGV